MLPRHLSQATSAFWALIVLVGCASTDLRDRQTGRLIARFQSNIASGTYSDGATRFSFVAMDNSTPTVAGGNAFATGTQAVTSGATGMIVAGGALKAATAGQAIVRGAAPAAIAVIPQKAAKAPSTPVPALTPAQIWPDKTNP